MSEEKLITYADLDTLRGVRRIFRDGTPRASLLDRLIAAAEADQPPLPEGWYAFESVTHGTLHVYVKGGMVSASDVCVCDECSWGRVIDYVHRLTPLRPTATPEQIEAAARVVSGYPKESWAGMSTVAKGHHLDRALGILAAAGIEVRP